MPVTGQDKQSFFFTPLGTKAYTEEYESSAEEDPEEDAVSRCCATVNSPVGVLCTGTGGPRTDFNPKLPRPCFHCRSQSRARRSRRPTVGPPRRSRGASEACRCSELSYRHSDHLRFLAPSCRPFSLFLLCKNCFELLLYGENRSFADPTLRDDLLTRKPGLHRGFARLYDRRHETERMDSR